MKKIIAAVSISILASALIWSLEADISANEKVEKVAGISSLENPKGKKLFVVGDSTLSSFNDPYYYPRYGYGTKLQEYLNEKKIEVVNLAMSGRSSKSFLTETNYQTLKSNIKKGDYLLIGFGHNDEKTEEARYTNPNGKKDEKGSFKNSLYENYVKLAQDVGAIPILATPIVRRAPGKSYEGSYVHITKDVEGFPGGDYPKAIRELAKECNVLLIDNTEFTKSYYQKLGDEGTLKLHAWLSNKPASVDNTHLNTYGASVIAYNVIGEIAKKDKAFSKLVKKGISEPVEVLILNPNPNYVIPTYEAFTSANKSAVFNVQEPWFGTVFGDCGGAEKIANPDFFEIVESGKNVSMHSGTKDTKTAAGKIASSSDGIAFYFQQIPASKDFTLKATAKVNAVAKNNQVSFGIMVRDDVYIDKFDNSIKSNYVSCGALKIASEPWTAGYQRKDTTLEENKAQNAAPKAGDVFELTISKKGNDYTVQFGKESPVTFTNNLTEVDSDFVYAGLYTARAAFIDFSNISLAVE